MITELKPPSEAHYTVYKLTDPEGKCYIGCTGQRLKARWSRGQGYKNQPPIFECILYYGWENIRKEILCEKLTKTGAEKLEKWFVEFYDSNNPLKGYNCFTGGCRNGAVMRQLSREKLSRFRVALCMVNSDYNRKNRLSSRQYYLEHPEQRAIVAKKVHDFLQTPGGSAFINSSRKAKPVRCVETGVVYRSASAAEKATGLCSIHKACNGQRHVSGGRHWEYLNEKDRVNTKT